MPTITEARAVWQSREDARLYFAPHGELLHPAVAAHARVGRVLDLAELIQAKGDTEAAVDAFRHGHAMPADPSEVAEAEALAAS